MQPAQLPRLAGDDNADCFFMVQPAMNYASTKVSQMRVIKRIGNILFVGSLLFFLETAFEMYVLTILQGPQMIGFCYRTTHGLRNQ